MRQENTEISIYQLFTNLVEAVNNGNIEAVQENIKYLEDNNLLQTVLTHHIADEDSLIPNDSLQHNILHAISKSSNPSGVKLIIDKLKEIGELKQALQFADDSGFLPLHNVIQEGNVEITKLMIQASRDEGILDRILNHKTNLGDAIDLAIYSKNIQQGIQRQTPTINSATQAQKFFEIAVICVINGKNFDHQTLGLVENQDVRDGAELLRGIYTLAEATHPRLGADIPATTLNRDTLGIIARNLGNPQNQSGQGL